MTNAGSLAEPIGLKWPESKWPLPVALAALVAAADYLLYRQPGGLGWAALLLLLALTMIAMHATRLPLNALLVRATLAAGSILPLVENVSPLSLGVAATGMAMLALLCSGRLRHGGGALLNQLAGFFLIAPFRLALDVLKARTLHGANGLRWIVIAQALVWIVPVAFGGVFLLLFGIANPIIEDWLRRFDPLALLGQVDPVRLAFWVVAACGLWAYLRPRFARLGRNAALGIPGQIMDDATASAVFGPAALLRSLVVFNGLFAVQNGLDIAYLWGGVALPEGMSYASYAHRGAYALIATALLAGGFVLATMRPGGETSSNPLIRKLVYLWTGQNIWLVVSSILRLDLYVDIYALTYWRVAAFLWMLLVGSGLALILARIALEKSNRWLVSANLLTLSALLYACCFINFAGLIANYNVEHSLEVRGDGAPVDIPYLASLGPEALPAFDRIIARRKCPDCIPDRYLSYVHEQRAELTRMTDRWTANWRYATFRNLRLMRYLETEPIAGSFAPDPTINPAEAAP